MPEWSGSGLQNRLHGFDSRRRLHHLFCARRWVDSRIRRTIYPVPAVVIVLVVLAVLTGGCAPLQSDPGTFLVTAKAGPTCPVVTEPPDPGCADRNVAGAPIVVTRADGSGVVAQGTTDARGRIKLTVPPGVYLVGAGDVEGLIAPEALELEVASGGTTETVLHYDTGMR